MKKIQSFLAFFLAITISLSAGIFNVNNNPHFNADFDDLQEALDSPVVMDGDTLLVHGSNQNYGNIVLRKKLAIIGTGYFISENPETQATLSEAVIGNLTIQSLASGSQVTGISFEVPQSGSFAIFIEDVDNILIRRNFIDGTTNRFGSSSAITVTGVCNNIHIVENYIIGKKGGNGGFSTGVAVGSSCANVVVRNNIIDAQLCFSLNNTIFDQNVVISSMGGGANSCFISNNIFTTESNISLTNCSTSHNILVGDFFPDSNGNQLEVSEFNIFAGYPDNPLELSRDKRFELKSTSVAIGSGLDPLGNVTDCGVFGGNSPYVLSGIPRIPNIHFLGIPQNATYGGDLPIKIKVNAN